MKKRLPMVAAGCISIPVLRAARCRYPACEEEHPAAIAPIGSAVHSYSFKTRIEEEDFERASRGGVAPFEGAYILPEPVKHKYQLLELG